MCQSIYVNRSLKLKFTIKIRKNPFSQNYKISGNDFESEITNEKNSLCLCNLLLQSKEEFIIPVVSEIVITNSIT